MSVTEHRSDDRYQALVEYVAARVKPAGRETLVRMCEERLVELARGAMGGLHSNRTLAKFDKEFESKLHAGYPSVVQAVFDTLTELRKVVPEEITALARAFDTQILELVPG
jgi:hypothetical protein